MLQKIWKIAGEELTDEQLVRNILKGNPRISKEFFYKTCYPLFASIYNKYYTDCETVLEFINEIYLYLIYPSKDPGKCKLDSFSYRCSFAMWLKIVVENYCHHLFAKKKDIEGIFSFESDRWDMVIGSFDSNEKDIAKYDAQKILLSMPNERYRKLIQYRYLEERTNEETAQLLSMNMANYYNKHKLAKAQFCAALRKEELL